MKIHSNFSFWPLDGSVKFLCFYAASPLDSSSQLLSFHPNFKNTYSVWPLDGACAIFRFWQIFLFCVEIDPVKRFLSDTNYIWGEVGEWLNLLGKPNNDIWLFKKIFNLRNSFIKHFFLKKLFCKLCKVISGRKWIINTIRRKEIRHKGIP